VVTVYRTDKGDPVADIIIRNYRREDEPAVEDITYRTGFKGEDLTGRDFFDDRRLFFMLLLNCTQ